MTYKETIKTYYSNIGLISQNGRILPLDRSCEYRSYCWGKIRADKESYRGIMLPHIGDDYENKTKLMVIAINSRANHNQDVLGIDSDSIEIRKKAEEIRKSGYISNNAERFYEIVAQYSADFLLNKGIEHHRDRKALLADSLEKSIVFIQAVKCNPPKKVNDQNAPLCGFR